MPHQTFNATSLSRKTLEVAKLFLALNDDLEQNTTPHTIDNDLHNAREDLYVSLKSQEEMAYVFLAHPDEFSQICANVVTAAQKHSELEGFPFISTRQFQASDFRLDYHAKELELIGYIEGKRPAFERVDDALIECAEQTRRVAPEYMASAITGLLARQMVPPVSTGNKIMDEKQEKDAWDKYQKMLRPHVTTAFEELSDRDKTNPERIRDKIMTEVVCTDFFLMKLQNEPATSYIKKGPAQGGGGG